MALGRLIVTRNRIGPPSSAASADSTDTTGGTSSSMMPPREVGSLSSSMTALPVVTVSRRTCRYSMGSSSTTVSLMIGTENVAVRSPAGMVTVLW